MAEVLHANLAKIEASDVLERLGLEPQKYILLSAHREEKHRYRTNFIDLFTSINHLAETYDMPILYSCHPAAKSGWMLGLQAGRARQVARASRLPRLQLPADERLCGHLGFRHAAGGIQLFTSVGHPFPAVCIRTSTERPEALDKACFVKAGIRAGGVEQAVGPPWP